MKQTFVYRSRCPAEQMRRRLPRWLAELPFAPESLASVVIMTAARECLVALTVDLSYYAADGWLMFIRRLLFADLEMMCAARVLKRRNRAVAKTCLAARRHVHGLVAQLNNSSG